MTALILTCYIVGLVFNFFVTALWARKWPTGFLAKGMRDDTSPPLPFVIVVFWPITIFVLLITLLFILWNKIANPLEKKIVKGKTSEGGYR